MIPTGARVWIAMGHTDMRRGMQGLALQVQQHLHRDPHGGDLFVFRGRSGSLVKIIWHDGLADGEEQRLVEQLVAHATVEAFDEPVLRRLARRDVMPLDAHVAGPGEHRVRRQFGPVAHW